MLIFTHGIKANARSPLELRSLINSAVTPDVQTEENIVPVFGTYKLRERRVVKSVVPETKYETLTFKQFFAKLLKTFNTFHFSLRRDPFRLQVNLNLNENLKLNQFYFFIIVKWGYGIDGLKVTEIDHD